MKLARYSKTITALVGAVIAWVGTCWVPDADVTRPEWYALLVAIAVAAGVYAVPNAEDTILIEGSLESAPLVDVDEIAGRVAAKLLSSDTVRVQTSTPKKTTAKKTTARRRDGGVVGVLLAIAVAVVSGSFLLGLLVSKWYFGLLALLLFLAYIRDRTAKT